MSENNLQEDSFYKYLISNGYYFDKGLIENYLLSLKVKPFEILTGNSGTGKTKLAQLFAQFLFISTFPEVEMSLTNSVWNENWGTLKRKSIKEYIPINEFGGNFDILIDDMPANGKVYLQVQLQYDDEELKNYFKELHKNYKSYTFKINPELVNNFVNNDIDDFESPIIVSQTSNSCSYDNNGKKPEWTLSTDYYNYTLFPKGWLNGEILVDGKLYSAKIRVLGKLYYDKDEEIQEYLKKNDGKDVKVEIKVDPELFKNITPNKHYPNLIYEILPVGANWTDNTNIIGYHNVITNDYQSTPAYELIKQAQKDSENPYFLILDEMNLSHVERYFSDFLSAIESGEEIPLYGNNKTLTLPNNLFIIGTVNVDETTYMFSPKVLDRANTLEFDTLLAEDYMASDSNDDDFDGDINYLQSPLLDSDISELNIEDLKEILDDISYNGKSLWDILANELTLFQKILKNSSFDFGFRVINEILRFMVVAWRYENSPNEWKNWERYFDAQIKQKILPKLHGSEKAIGIVLKGLFNLCLVERNGNESPKNFNINNDNSRYVTSALKLQNMSKVLSDQRYVSFIN
ncbi:McrB family protein [uncultured Methanobrevibacter sp.]|uniref:McrB family protein n=1 Tax=uncultured Methanobrevibacter sp. TaxID=253161 RepID=UPI0025D36F08|nr:hypothetical protein [uncultured Methanobrevibacter sp.]